MQTVHLGTLDRIRSKGRGKVFSSKDFLDLGSRDAVDQALSRLARAGELRRLGRGLYHYPRTNQRLGLELPPDPDEIAFALGRRTGTRGGTFGCSCRQPPWPHHPGSGKAGLLDGRPDGGGYVRATRCF